MRPAQSPASQKRQEAGVICHGWSADPLCEHTSLLCRSACVRAGLEGVLGEKNRLKRKDKARKGLPELVACSFFLVTAPHWIPTHIWAMITVIVWPFPGTVGGVILMFF